MIAFIAIILFCVIGFFVCEARRLNKSSGKKAMNDRFQSIVQANLKSADEKIGKELVYNIWMALSDENIQATHGQIVEAIKFEMVSAYASNLTFEMNSAFAA